MTECMVCGTDQLNEITTLAEAVPRYLCRNGHVSRPDQPAPSMAFRAFGPTVPTAWDILRAAGLTQY